MRIFVSVKLKRQEEIRQIDDTHFEAAVNAAPVEGKANKRLMELLADYFNIPKSRLVIRSGETSRDKVIEII